MDLGISKLLSFLTRGLRSRWGGRRALASFLMQGSAIGLYNNSWTDSRYEQVRHFRHWVYIAVDRIATEIAMHSPNVSLVRGPEPEVTQAPRPRANTVPRHVRQKALTPLLSHEELEPVKDNHPLLRLLRDPNEPDTAYDLWYETTLFLLLTGNAYWWLPPNALGYPAAIWVLPSHWVWASVGRERMIDSYEIRPVEGNYVRMSIPAKDVIHFRRKSPVSKIDGYAPLAAMNQWVDTSESIDRTRWFSFRNGVFPGVAVTFDGKVKLPNEEALNRIEARFMGRYSGEIQANRPILVPPGAQVKKLQLTNQEMMFLESAEQMRKHILKGFGVPDNETMTYGAVRASQADYYMRTVNPLYRFYGHTVTHKLCPRYDRRLRVWWEDRTPEDPEMREKSIQTDFLVGAITPNEVRALRGREPYPYGGSDPLVQGALMSLPYVTGGKVVSMNNPSTSSSPSPKPEVADEREPFSEDPNE